MSNANTPPPEPPSGPGSPRDVPPPPGSFPIDPATLPEPIRREVEAPDPVAIDTASDELKDGVNRCPKCGATDIRQRPGTDLLVCLYCRHEWHGARVEEAFGLRRTAIGALVVLGVLLLGVLASIGGTGASGRDVTFHYVVALAVIDTVGVGVVAAFHLLSRNVAFDPPLHAGHGDP